jgi:DNA-binding response OmpR family regulator
MIRKLLLVDDDRDIHSFIRSVLQTQWINIQSAYTGKQALSEFRNQEYDLIVTDLAMPEMDGLELIKELKKSAYHVPTIVVISSLNESTIIMNCLSSGVSDYITKPAEPERIRKTVYGLLHLDEDGTPIAQRSLASYMGEMTMMKSTGKLLLDDGKNMGEMYYENGRLKNISFGTLKGIEALELAKKSRLLRIELIGGNFIIGEFQSAPPKPPPEGN